MNYHVCEKLKEMQKEVSIILLGRNRTIGVGGLDGRLVVGDSVGLLVVGELVGF